MTPSLPAEQKPVKRRRSLSVSRQATIRGRWARKKMLAAVGEGWGGIKP